MAPLIFERMEFLNRDKNPYFEHAEAEYFLAERDGESVGRISAQIDHALGRVTRAAATRCSASLSRAVTPRSLEALLGAADEWAARQGRSACSARWTSPPTTRVGILIEGFERRPMILEPGTRPTTGS